MVLDFSSISSLNNKEVKERVEKLKIPPNWTDVKISNDYSSKIQVIGIDSKGRKQYIYHPLWKLFTNNIKYKHISNFDIKKLNNVINKFIKLNNLSKECIICNMLKLMIDLNIRVGNEIYYEKYNSIGLCTMLKCNVCKETNNIYKLKFNGKKGVNHEKILNTNHIKFVNKLINLPGDLLFQYQDNNLNKYVKILASDINDFLKNYIDDNISTKDIRTYQANQIFINTINTLKKNKEFNDLNSINKQKKLQREALKITANELGNTPIICKQSYINPELLL
jgi:DNA topoisomerase I